MAYDGAIAVEVLENKTENIKQACLDIPTLCNELSNKGIIKRTQKAAITGFKNFKDDITKMEEIIGLVVSTVEGNGSNFNIFLEALRTGQAKRGKDLADMLNAYYHQLAQAKSTSSNQPQEQTDSAQPNVAVNDQPPQLQTNVQTIDDDDEQQDHL